MIALVELVKIQKRDRLTSGEDLTRGQQLQSKNGKFFLGFSFDGNLIFRFNGIVIWDLNRQLADPRLLLTKNGNLELYDQKNRQLIYTTQTKGINNSLVVGNDGNFFIYDSEEKVLWSSKKLISKFNFF